MITEKELDEMARYYFSDRPEFQERREQWKDNYRARHPDKVTPTTGAANMPPERVENGRQFQEEMITRGFDKLSINFNRTENGYDRVLDYTEATKHMEHVIALVANTATQQSIRRELEFITGIEKDGSDCLDRITGNWIQSSGYSGYFAAVNSKAIERKAHLTQCLAELEAQFADLSEKIFGTDKPLTDETT